MWQPKFITPRPSIIGISPYATWTLDNLVALSGSGTTTVYSPYFDIAGNPGWYACPGFTMTASNNAWSRLNVDTWDSTSIIESVTVAQMWTWNSFTGSGTATSTAYTPFMFLVQYAFTRFRFSLEQFKFPYNPISFTATPLNQTLYRLYLF